MTDVTGKWDVSLITVGFIDTTCSPSTIYAACNAHKILKGIYDDIPCGHANSPEAMNAMAKHFEDMKGLSR